MTLKLSHWERGGFVIYYKGMDSGRASHKVFLNEGFHFMRRKYNAYYHISKLHSSRRETIHLTIHYSIVLYFSYFQMIFQLLTKRNGNFFGKNESRSVHFWKMHPMVDV